MMGMYLGDPPTVLETEVFTTLPDVLVKRVDGKPRNFLEGPSFDRHGNLLCVDVQAGRVYRISPNGDWEILAEYDGVPNGLKLHRDGRAFIADRKRGVMVLDPARATLDCLLPGPKPGESFVGLNDLIFATNGDLYFTDQGRTGLQSPTGRVWRYTEAGVLECLIDNVPSPNGLVFNLRETALYVAVTRANAVWRIELDDPARRTGLFVQLSAAGPDGLALDASGNVVVAHPTVGAVWMFNRIGTPVYYLKSCAKEMTTNIAYGGDDNRTLFVTESRSCSILWARLPVPGKAMFSHR
ncbi:MAG TPA: SMP-30/gluconolactonase/LRE family protein [Acetobacteraceae bacterium]|jgi:gluconolactonase|nr:SMP-30/gluconolactonase/LRE family protein [Acetobacteraceae bacterium]